MTDDKAEAAYHPRSTPGGRDLLNAIVENKIRLERERQIELGYDQHHDDEHGIDHLAAQADEYRRKGEYVQSLALWRAHDEALARRLVIIQRQILRQNPEGSQS
jgi:hypothetical protein